MKQSAHITFLSNMFTITLSSSPMSPNSVFSLDFPTAILTEFLWSYMFGPWPAIAQSSDSLRDGRSGDRIPVEAIFYVTFQTGPGDHPASCTVGTVLFPGVKRPGLWPSTPSSAKVKERVELYLYSPSGPSRTDLGWTLHMCSAHLRYELTIKGHTSSVTT